MLQKSLKKVNLVHEVNFLYNLNNYITTVPGVPGYPGLIKPYIVNISIYNKFFTQTSANQAHDTLGVLNA